METLTLLLQAALVYLYSTSFSKLGIEIFNISTLIYLSIQHWGINVHDDFKHNS